MAADETNSKSKVQKRSRSRYKSYLSHSSPLAAAPRRSRSALQRRVATFDTINVAETVGASRSAGIANTDIDSNQLNSEGHETTISPFAPEASSSVTPLALSDPPTTFHFFQELNPNCGQSDDDSYLDSYQEEDEIATEIDSGLEYNPQLLEIPALADTNNELDVCEIDSAELLDSTDVFHEIDSDDTNFYADEDWESDDDSNTMEKQNDILVNEKEHVDDSEYTDATCGNTFEEQPLYAGAPITLGTSIILIMTFAMTHSVSGEALSTLLGLIAAHCITPNLCTTSLYKFKSFFKELRTPLLFHYYCPFCQGLLESGVDTSKCPYCDLSLANNPGFKKSFFIEIPIQQQLMDLFSKNGFYEDLGYRFKRKKKNDVNIEDVQDGLEYKRYFQPGGLLTTQENIALQFNTDGVALFKSSSYKIWPVFIEILDLPPVKRRLRENLLFVGLWFGGPPAMNTFLKPFTKALMDLEQTGVAVKLWDGTQKTCKAVLLNGTFDLPARCIVCNMIQFNGHCGCGLCEEPGETVHSRKGSGHSHIYPMSHEKAKTSSGHAVWRTKESTNDYAQQALNSGKTVQGVKGHAVFSYLPNFDMIKGIPVDYMHGVLLGVTKGLMSCWFNSQFSQEEWYCGNRVKEVDKMLERIKPPNDLTRTPRSIENHRKFWKASELRSWLFHYSVPVMSGVLKPRFLHHLMLLVKGIYNLSKDSISAGSIAESFVLLKTFVYYMDKLYGLQACTANVHYLLHLPQCVIWNGPLWTFSCFAYEDANGKLRQLFHGTQHVEMQIVAAASLTAKLPTLAKRIPVGTPASVLYSKMTDNFALSMRKWEFVNEGCYMIGASKYEAVDGPVAIALRNVLGAPVSSAYLFSRAMIHGRVFHSKRYQRVQRRNSYSVMFSERSNISYGQINCFAKIRYNHCKCQMTSICSCRSWIYLAIVNKLMLPPNYTVHVSDGALEVTLEHIVKAYPAVAGNLVGVPLEHVLNKVIYMELQNKDLVYLSQFPNVIEKD